MTGGSARSTLACLVMCLGAALMAQERWHRTYDTFNGANGLTGVALDGSGYFIQIQRNYTALDGLTSIHISPGGDTVSTLDVPFSGMYLYGGSSGSLQSLGDGTFVRVDARYHIADGETDAILLRLEANGDTLWTRTYGPVGFDVANAVSILPDSGFALFGTVQTGGEYDMRLIRTDAQGNALWTRTYGGPEDQQCLSGQRTLDGGYILSGFKYFNNDHLNMYVVKTDSAGNQQWHHWYGSPWIDNSGFILQLPDSGYLLAGAKRNMELDFLHPSLYRLNKTGGVLWSETYDPDIYGVFYAIPILTADGFTLSGGRYDASANVIGMLMHVDEAGVKQWERTYQTNSQTDHYFYDAKRTLDGGYIMAGTAFDSLLVSQDAWLVKVDSFGCLVPGCQVFDGMQEQVTDLRDALEVFPNPASAQVTVRVALPDGFNGSGTLRLALVSAEGKLVQEEAVASMAPSHVLDVTRCAPGLYYVHLLDGTRWLSGTKLMVE